MEGMVSMLMSAGKAAAPKREPAPRQAPAPRRETEARQETARAVPSASKPQDFLGRMRLLGNEALLDMRGASWQTSRPQSGFDGGENRWKV